MDLFKEISRKLRIGDVWIVDIWNNIGIYSKIEYDLLFISNVYS